MDPLFLSLSSATAQDNLWSSTGFGQVEVATRRRWSRRTAARNHPLLCMMLINVSLTLYLCLLGFFFLSFPVSLPFWPCLDGLDLETMIHGRELRLIIAQITYIMVGLVRFQVGYPVRNPRSPTARSTDNEVCKIAKCKSHSPFGFGHPWVFSSLVRVARYT
ncbi:uncharacterized protein BDW43DRAFT_94987 [Aspergillus alliaceus]|uniref:uncharacterized protein n=1 Tax=Petromyces alliaceus TaxID=209559 RepID=UPI0012A455C5|nr:uncharacterized protein BDW43DRAFT_94987 [Aspergillus alliaceus]KAB8233135.1 hypothetical protein BDW43DRAFT_94987 [Aspergillus alliaceus]